MPAENRNLEERQSVDMAEYAFLRHDTGANKARCIECLKAVYDSCPTSFWGWAAFRRIAEVDGFLKEATSNDCREWRFVVTRPRDPAETLYLNSRRHFPTRNFYRLINNVPYRRTSCFGASKFRKFSKHMKAWEGYMRPWEASGLSRLYLRSRIGGVCVEQSKWAAYAANSQGLMAVTGGQPGRRATKFCPKSPPHLSWVLRGANGNWRVLNNIRPYTHSVFSIWGSDFQHLLSVERAFADREAHDEAELLLFAGRTR